MDVGLNIYRAFLGACDPSLPTLFTYDPDLVHAQIYKYQWETWHVPSESDDAVTSSLAAVEYLQPVIDMLWALKQEL